MPLSQLVGRIKANSGKWVNGERKANVRFEWQRGYSAFSVSKSTAAYVRQYIESQREHHAKTSFRDELAAFLDAHAIEFDERYLLG